MTAVFANSHQSHVVLYGYFTALTTEIPLPIRRAGEQARGAKCEVVTSFGLLTLVWSRYRALRRRKSPGSTYRFNVGSASLRRTADIAVLAHPGQHRAQYARPPDKMNWMRPPAALIAGGDNHAFAVLMLVSMRVVVTPERIVPGARHHTSSHLKAAAPDGVPDAIWLPAAISGDIPEFVLVCLTGNARASHAELLREVLRGICPFSGLVKLLHLHILGYVRPSRHRQPGGHRRRSPELPCPVCRKCQFCRLR